MEKPYSSEQGSEEESVSETALIPKSMLPGEVKAGDMISLKVVHIYDDEVEVEFSGSDEEDDESESESSEQMTANDELDQLAKE